MKIRHLLRKLGIILIASVMSLAVVGGGSVWAGGEEGEGDSSGSGSNVQIEPTTPAECATILKDWCNEPDEKTIISIIKFVISVLSVGIGVLATIGLIICGYLIMTARDNEAQVSKAKKRLLEIVIGVVIWALGAALVYLLVPDPTAANYMEPGAAEGGVIIFKELK